MAAPTHICPDCGRAYQAAESLTRHRKNHGESSENVCHVCGATFKRKDILTRHYKIHNNQPSISVRSRVPRACIRCSSIKSKCDNRRPCSRCARGGHVCIYSELRTRALTGKVSLETGRDNESYYTDQASSHISGTPCDEEAQGIVSTNNDQNEFVEWPQDLDLDMSWMDDPSLRSSLWSLIDENVDRYQQQQAISGPSLATDSDRTTSGDMLWNQSTAPTPSQFWSMPAPFDYTENVGSEYMHRPVYSAAPLGHFHHPPTTAPQMQISMNLYPSHPATLAQGGAKNDSTHATMQQLSLVNGPPSWEQAIEELTDYALDFSIVEPSKEDRLEFWEAAAYKIELGFGLVSLAPAGMHVLDYFLKRFFDDYYPICPLLLQLDCGPHSLPNHLYLTIVGIGAGYAGEIGAEFHRQILRSLRIHLTRATFEQELPQEALQPLCQSLTYIQSAILHFGHTTAFPYLQQLASLTASLARKLDLFNEPTNRPTQASTSTRPAAESRTVQKPVEVRRQLAFTLLKFEVFNSLLLDSRPAISYEEINLCTPISRGEWLKSIPGEAPETQEGIGESSRYFYSNLVSISMDRDEQYPSLRPSELEAVLFGIQPHVWRFSYGRLSAMRPALDLSLDKLDLEGDANSDEIVNDHHDLPGFSHRWMRDLRLEHSRLVAALVKWQSAFNTSVRPEDAFQHRDSLLASRLLYNVSLMKLGSNLPVMHQIALSCINDKTPQEDFIKSVYKWASSKVARVAVQHACSTWSLVAVELSRTDLYRANFNILTQVALLNAAVIIWAYAGTQNGAQPRTLLGSLFQVANVDAGRLSICRDNTASLMSSFADLVKGITPEWTPGTSRYHVTVSSLIHNTLPLMT